MKENVVQAKSYEFAKQIVFLYKDLRDRKEYALASQLLRAGTSVGANVEEAIGGQSKKDFIHKISISYKEARETKYWLRLLADTNYLDHKTSEKYLNDCEELLKILGSILKSSRKN